MTKNLYKLNDQTLKYLLFISRQVAPNCYGRYLFDCYINHKKRNSNLN